VISVQNLRYRYPHSNKEAVAGISFEVAPGEIFGFLGPSGAGKSTTQKVLIGLLKDYGGSSLVKGREISAWNRAYYSHIGVGFELPNLYSKFTALENLNFFAALYDKPCGEPLELLKMVDLDQDAHTRVAEFSKGMKMRLNFCRALLHDPEILFLDEPTSGLDPQNARRIMEIILEQRSRGKTVFLTTHNMTVADELCNRVAFMVDGRIPVIGSPRELKIQHGKKYVRVETRRKGSLQQQDFPLQGIGENRDFLSLLQSQEVETIHSQEASLEDVFMASTGRGLV